MPFDRAAAKAAGYSDAEIDAYIAQRPDPVSARTRRPDDVAPVPRDPTPTQRQPLLPEMTAPGRFHVDFPGGEEPGLEGDTLSPVDAITFLLGGPLGQAGGAAAGLAGRMARGGAGLLGRAASAPVLRRFPGSGFVRGVSQDVEGIAARRAPVALGSAPKVAPKRKPFRPKKKVAKAKAEPETPVAARVRKTQAMRGASGPELERRAAARARAVGRPRSEAPELAVDFMDPLEASIMLEQRMAAEGLTPAERIFLRAALRQR